MQQLPVSTALGKRGRYQYDTTRRVSRSKIRAEASVSRSRLIGRVIFTKTFTVWQSPMFALAHYSCDRVYRLSAAWSVETQARSAAEPGRNGVPVNECNSFGCEGVGLRQPEKQSARRDRAGDARLLRAIGRERHEPRCADASALAYAAVRIFE